MFGESTDSNINGRLTQKRETCTIAYLSTTKEQVISNQINKNRKNSKGLSQIINKLTGNKAENPMPPGKTDKELAEDFTTFFLEKKSTKYENNSKQYQHIDQHQQKYRNLPILHHSPPVKCKKEILEVKNNSCKLDIIPTTLLKEILPTCLHTITQIVNPLLIYGDFNGEWKTAIVRHLLKKIGLELIHKNYTPVSNLCFLSKLVKRCMLKQLMDHCNENHLLPDFQSTYRKHYSTKTSLLKMVSAIL